MREWLLKDEEKNKVGRPKLADSKTMKQAKALLFFSFSLCVVLSFCFISALKEVNPASYAYELTFSKLLASATNKNGFIVKMYYDDNEDYAINVKVTDAVYKYSGDYKYTLYYLSDDEWKEFETKTIDKEKRDFNISIESLKNENRTWKLKLQIINGAKIEESYAPSGWHFVNSKNQDDMYAYKIFTVKGYYSPVTLKEIKESKKNKDKIYLLTNKNAPRKFILKTPSKVNINVKYTDINDKEVWLVKGKEVQDGFTFSVPNLEKSTKVNIKICSNSISVNDLKLSNWRDDKNNCISNIYILKPEKSYKN